MSKEEHRKTVLLTGASGKIGRVLVEQLLNSGFAVIAQVYQASSAQSLLSEFQSYANDKQLIALQSDLCDPESRKALLEQVIALDKPIYGIINNARSLSTLKQDETGLVSEADFMQEFNLGVYAAYELAFQLAQRPQLQLQRVINVASIYGVVASNLHLYQHENQALPLHYGVVKAALIHLTKEMAVRFAHKGITVNAVSYGGVEGRVDANFLAKYAELSPQGNMLSKDDLAGPIAFLLSEGSSAVTGHNLMADGGWTIW